MQRMLSLEILALLLQNPVAASNLCTCKSSHVCAEFLTRTGWLLLFHSTLSKLLLSAQQPPNKYTPGRKIACQQGGGQDDLIGPFPSLNFYA